jgi:hypothetical protein
MTRCSLPLPPQKVVEAVHLGLLAGLTDKMAALVAAGKDLAVLVELETRQVHPPLKGTMVELALMQAQATALVAVEARVALALLVLVVEAVLAAAVLRQVLAEHQLPIVLVVMAGYILNLAPAPALPQMHQQILVMVGVAQALPEEATLLAATAAPAS